MLAQCLHYGQFCSTHSLLFSSSLADMQQPLTGATLPAPDWLDCTQLCQSCPYIPFSIPCLSLFVHFMLGKGNVPFSQLWGLLVLWNFSSLFSHSWCTHPVSRIIPYPNYQFLVQKIEPTHTCVLRPVLEDSLSVKGWGEHLLDGRKPHAECRYSQHRDWHQWRSGILQDKLQASSPQAIQKSDTEAANCSAPAVWKVAANCPARGWERNPNLGRHRKASILPK